MNLANARHAWQLFFSQLLVTLAAALVLIFPGWVHAWSGLIGGMISALASLFFGLRVFVHYRAEQPEKLLRQFFGAEFQKLLLTGFLFAGAILLVKPLSVWALFGVYLLVQILPALIAHRLD